MRHTFYLQATLATADPDGLARVLERTVAAALAPLDAPATPGAGAEVACVDSHPADCVVCGAPGDGPPAQAAGQPGVPEAVTCSQACWNAYLASQGVAL